MTRRHQLETTLRTLKLSGMLDTLEARLAQARAGELGHLEFLQALCEDEITRRDAAAARSAGSARPASSRPPPSRTSTSPTTRRSPPPTSATSPPCASSTPASRSSSTAPSGSARRIIAQALGHQACRRGYTARVHQDQPAARRPRRRPRRPHLGRPAARWARPDVLILDDFAMRDFTAAQADDLYELITERAEPQPRPHRQPGRRRLVSAVPQPRRRRVDPRPARQHRPPRPHGRPQLPAQQAARPPRHREGAATD